MTKRDNSWCDDVELETDLDRAYAKLLDDDDGVISWRYKFIPIIYFDHVTGEELIYHIKFYVEKENEICWIETKPADEMVPEDKYLYAWHAAKNAEAEFRGLNQLELTQMESSAISSPT